MCSYLLNLKCFKFFLNMVVGKHRVDATQSWSKFWAMVGCDLHPANGIAQQQDKKLSQRRLNLCWFGFSDLGPCPAAGTPGSLLFSHALIKWLLFVCRAGQELRSLGQMLKEHQWWRQEAPRPPIGACLVLGRCWVCLCSMVAGC